MNVSASNTILFRIVFQAENIDGTIKIYQSVWKCYNQIQNTKVSVHYFLVQTIISSNNSGSSKSSGDQF